MRIKSVAIFLFVFSNSYADSWTQKASLTGARNSAVGFSIGNKGYIGTGYNSGPPPDITNYYKDFWEYDPNSNVWTQKADFGGGRRSTAVGFSIGTKGYIGTGLNPNGMQNDFWEWDQASNTWSMKANFAGISRQAAVGFSIGTKGYIGTGSPSANTFIKDFWEWDGDTSSATYNTWIQRADFGGVGRQAVGFSIGTKGYIGTGGDAFNLYKDFWEWDQATNIWMQKTDFGGGLRQAAVGFSIGSKGYIGTGTDGSVKKDFWEYDQATNIWTKKVDFGGAARWIATGFSIGSKGYLGMGFFFTVSTNDFWEYCDTCTIGIDELSNRLEVEVFPNPAIDKLTINTYNKYYPSLKAEIYNITGEKVFEKEYYNISSPFQIDVSKYKQGIYFLKLNSKDEQQIFKILI